MDLSGSFLTDLVPDRQHVRALRIVLLVAVVYPPYLLTCYMAAKGFYAHEIFSSIVGLVVPVLFMALVVAPLLLLFILLFWGGILGVIDTVLERVWRRDPGPPGVPFGRVVKEWSVLLVRNLLVLGASYYVGSRGGAEDAAGPLRALIIGSLGLGVALVVVARAPLASRVGLLAVLLVAALLLPLFGQESTTGVVETILAQFRLGGVMVTLVPHDDTQDTSTRLYGRLVFLSSSNLYLEAECPRKLMVVPRRDSLRLEFAEIRTAGLREFRCEGSPPSSAKSQK
jgi:hypothetical protein